MARTVLDLKGLLCPIPVLRANKAMKALQPGDELQVAVTDKAAPADFVAYCKTSGHEHLGCRDDAGTFTIVLRKTA